MFVPTLRARTTGGEQESGAPFEERFRKVSGTLFLNVPEVFMKRF